TRLRGRVATIVASAITVRGNGSAVSHQEAAGKSLGTTLTGIDVLVKDGFQALKGRKIGLVTNHSGRNRDGRSTTDLLYRAPGVSLVALFSPEHGIRGVA